MNNTPSETFKNLGFPVESLDRFDEIDIFIRSEDYSGFVIESLSQTYPVYFLQSSSPEKLDLILVIVRSCKLSPEEINDYQQTARYLQLWVSPENKLALACDIFKASQVPDSLLHIYTEFKEEALKFIEIARNPISLVIISVESALKNYGISNYKSERDGNKHMIKSIVNKPLDNGRLIKLPFFIKITENFLIFMVYVSYQDKFARFSERSRNEFLLEYLAKMNCRESLGAFHLVKNDMVYFMHSLPLLKFPEEAWQGLIIESLKLPISRMMQRITDFEDIINERPPSSFSKEEEIRGKEEESLQEEGNSSQEENDDSRVCNDPESFQEELRFYNKIKSNPEIAQYFDLHIEFDHSKHTVFYPGYNNNTLKRAILNSEFDKNHHRPILELIMLLYKHRIYFRDFPGDFIIHSFNSETIVRIQAFKLRTMVTEEPVVAEESKYRGFILKSTTRYIFEIKSQLGSEPNKFDYIDNSQLGDPQIRHEKNLIGKGGYGLIYKNTYLGAEVAIKLPRARESKETPEEGSKNLIKEFKLMKQLEHPNLMRAIGLIKVERLTGIVLELCQPNSLRSRLKEMDNYSFERLNKENLEHIYNAAKGLSFMHLKGISHYDLKPDNIFFKLSGQALIGDFGFSKNTDTLSSNHTYGFSLRYASAGQLRNEYETANKPSDIWSFGITMYEALIGRVAYRELFIDNSKPSKRKYLHELETMKRTPLLPVEFQRKHRILTHVMRECWTKSENRIRSSTLAKKIGSVYNK